MAHALRHPGLILGLARFYHDPRGSIRAVLDSGPAEPRLLAYAVAAAGILLAGRIIELSGAVPGHGDLPARVAGQVVSLLFFLPLVYYALAGLGTLAARLFGGHGSWRDGRTAFFWAALVSAPVIVLGNLAAITLSALPLLSAAVGQVGALFLAWALAQCFAEAFGFRRSSLVLLVIAAPVVLAIGLALALRA